MRPVGGTPAALGWIAETVVGAPGALGGRGDRAAALRSPLVSLRDVVAAPDVASRRAVAVRRPAR
jgi:hypothetical protein